MPVWLCKAFEWPRRGQTVLETELTEVALPRPPTGRLTGSCRAGSVDFSTNEQQEEEELQPHPEGVGGGEIKYTN